MSNEPADRDYLDAEYSLIRDQVQRTYEFHANPDLRIPTGWESVDPYLLGGPAPGEVVYLLGRSHTGKSMFLLNIMYNSPHVPMVLFTLEMPYHQAITRLTAMATDQSDDVVWRQLTHHALDWSQSPLLEFDHWIIDDARLTLKQMGDIIWKLRHDYDEEMWPRAALIDYLELIRSPSKEYGYERTETLARELKAWSKEMELPVFVAHQSNMTIKRWEPPDEGAARGAGYTEADAVIGIWHPASDPSKNPSYEDQRIFKAKVIKNRIAGKLSEDLEFQLDSALKLWDPVRVERLRIF